jgi:PAS domain S-box-containing protein
MDSPRDHREPLDARSDSVSDAQFKKLVDVISRSQHNYRELIDNLDQAVFTLSLEGEVRVANRRLSEILGVPFPGLIGHKLAEFVEAPALSDIQGSLPSFVKNGSWAGTVLVRLKSDAKLRYFDCWLQALADEGDVASVSGWARDVTSHYEAEIRFAELFESLREGVFFTTTAGRFLDVNPAMVRLLGYDGKEELQARSLRDLYPNPAGFDSIVGELELKGSFQDRELPFKRKDGSVIYCLVSGFAIRDTFGKVVRLQGTLVDITERREIERKLHHEQEFVRRLVANFPDLIAVMDGDGRFTYVSQNVKDVWGGTPEKYIGDPFFTKADPEDQPKLVDMFQTVISGAESSGQVEFRALHPEGVQKILRASAGPLFDENGTITGMVASVRDVTESRLIEQQLLQKEKFAAMGQMMAGAAHELNNPLTAILGVAELLADRTSDEGQKRHLELVLQQARRAAAIVQNLLSFARPPTLMRSTMRLEEIVQDALQTSQSALSQKNVAVKVQVAPNLPPIVGDRKLLTQAFLNIIANAEQAISSGADHGSLMVSVSKVDDRVSVTFTDDGPGIPAANLGKIFDPFFTTKRPGVGSGLGLTIALAVVKEHGGMIDVESRPGAGATFQVLLPAVIRDDARKTSSPSSSATTAPSGYDFLSGHTALIVDDEESIREIVSEGLLSRGMKVESAESAEKALSLLETNVYDVVLCDFNLPRLSGEELFERLRQRSKTSIPRFVFMTGELVDSSRIAELAEKDAAVLQKPFRIPALAQLLVDMLESQSSKVL